jgi:flagellar motility protein MotE (MotC chaperone)
MTLRIPTPRLLPLTIFALSGLLAIKSVTLVRAAAGSSSAAIPAEIPAQTTASVGTEAKPPPKPSPAAPPPAPAVSDGERAVLLELRQRRQELDAREATVAARESVLQAAERKLTARVAELEALQRKLEALEAARQQREEASWHGLVKLYENMRPRDAARIFNELEMPVLLAVVDRMKEAKAAPILASMQPDKARELTAKLAAMRTRRDTPASGG